MNDIIKILALFGESCVGKDTIQDWIVHNIKNTHKIVSCTTRPKRENEKEGEDYFFLTPEQFEKDLLNGTMIEATSFREWFYGTPITSLDKNKINVGVFNIAGIDCLLTDNRFQVLPMRIVLNEKKRLERSLNRESNPNCEEICRRFLADQKDFLNIPFEYITFDNNDSSTDWFGIQNIPAINEFLADSGQKRLNYLA